MLTWLLVAAAFGQSAEPSVFAEAEGWSIARHDGGCLMTREFGGSGNTIVTVAVTPGDADAPLAILVGNGEWSFPEAADDDGYEIEFNDAVWGQLAVRTFNTEDEGDGRVDGVISIDFAADAAVPLLADIAGASGLHLSRRGVTVGRVAMSGTGAAVSKLGECVETLP